MDFNVVNKDVLMQAKNDPENRRNLIVRVCGYSAPFISLSEELQDEIIQRTMRTF
ncbi:MAG: glycine radical domain-containing protein [Mahellales bacterium]